MLTHKGTQTIETARLILRRAVRDDAEPMFRNWASDPEVTKFLTWPAHRNIAVSEMVIGSWLQEYEKDSYYQWMIELKEIGQPIGSISVVRQNDCVEEAEIGYQQYLRYHFYICEKPEFLGMSNHLLFVGNPKG